MKLQNARIIGFFSLPSPSLAEANPTAYNLAMAGAPAGAGTCAHCGNGIRHHVVVECEGVKAFIGTDCAERVGDEPMRRAVKARMTTAELAEMDAKRAAQIKANAEAKARQDAERAARRAMFPEVFPVLEAAPVNMFHKSLAEQLEFGPLTARQAHFVLKAVFGRRNKRNADAFDALAGKLEGVE